VLGWVGLVPWLLVLDRTRSAGEALAAGLAMSVAFVLAVFWWFGVAIAEYAGVSTVTGFVVLVLLAPVLQPQLPAFALARYVARRRAGWRRAAVTGACVWVGTEWAAGKLFGDTIGHGLQASAWMRQAADLAGAPGLTFVLLLANEHAAAAIRERASPRHALAAATGVAALALALCAYGTWRLGRLAPDGRPVTAAVVQTNLAHYDRLAAARGTHAAVRTILDTHYALSRAAVARGDIDVLVWSETVYPTTFGAPKSEDGAAFDREIASFVAGTRVPLVFGSYDLEDGVEYNAAVFLAPPSGGPLEYETYRKAWLFPLTERTPALFDRPWIRSRLPWLGTWQSGAGPAVVSLPLADGRRLPVAPLICYDAVAPRFALDAVRAGAQLIVTLSNDSWFAVGLGPRLHLVVAAFRSIETRRAQVRATTTGISAIIAASGEIEEAAGVHERAALVGAVRPESRATTLMLAWGDWFGPVAAALGVGLLGAGPAGRRALASLVATLALL